MITHTHAYTKFGYIFYTSGLQPGVCVPSAARQKPQGIRQIFIGSRFLMKMPYNNSLISFPFFCLKLIFLIVKFLNYYLVALFHPKMWLKVKNREEQLTVLRYFFGWTRLLKSKVYFLAAYHFFVTH